MVGIAVHLDRPERVRLHQHRNRARGERMRRRKIHRLAQDQVLGRLHVGEDRLVRLLGASGQPGQRQRRAHHLQEAAPADRIHPLTGLPRELALQHLVECRASPPARPGSSRSACRSGRPAWRAPRPASALAGRNRRHQLRAVASCSVFPVLCLCLLHRWHVSQLVSSLGGRMWYCAVRYLPRSIWLVNFW